MNELIKITENNGIKTVSARELFTFLESKQDFSDWIKNRIEKYRFIEGQDFTIILWESDGDMMPFLILTTNHFLYIFL